MRKLPHFLDKGDHSCGFYRDEGEKLRIALPFFRAGLLLGEKCIFIGSETDFSVIKTAIRDNKKSGSGVDEEKIMHIDSSAYLKAFQAGDFKALCGQWELLVKGFLAEGFRAIRGVGCLDMEYSPELESFLLEYEKCIAPLFHPVWTQGFYRGVSPRSSGSDPSLNSCNGKKYTPGREP